MLLGVEDERDLKQWEDRLKRLEVDHTTFVEPDRNNEKTALAVSPRADYRLFQDLRLL